MYVLQDRRAELILMAGAYQSRPSRGPPTASSSSTNRLPPENGQIFVPHHSQHSQKQDAPGVQLHSADQIDPSAGSSSAPVSLAGSKPPLRVNGHTSMQRSKPSYLNGSSSHSGAATAGKAQNAAQEERSKEWPVGDMSDSAGSRESKRVLRDMQAESATCSASKSPSATPDHRSSAENGGGYSSAPHMGLSHAQSGLSNLRLPDGNVLEEGPFDAQLHSGSVSSEGASESDDSPPPQPSTPKHGPKDSPRASIAAGAHSCLDDQLGHTRSETHGTRVQHPNSADTLTQSKVEPAFSHPLASGGIGSRSEDKGAPREVDHHPKAEMIADLFKKFLHRIGFDAKSFSIQVNNDPQWHGLPDIGGSDIVAVEKHIPDLGVLSFQHRRPPS